MQRFLRIISLLAATLAVLLLFVPIFTRTRDDLTREYVEPEQYGVNGNVVYSYSGEEHEDGLNTASTVSSFVEGNGYSQDEISIVNIMIDAFRDMKYSFCITTSLSSSRIKSLIICAMKAPDIYWVNGATLEYRKDGGEYTIYPSYSMTWKDKEKIQSSVNKKVSEFLEENDTVLNHDVWSAAYVINKWLCQNVIYTSKDNVSDDNYYPYNCIVAPLLNGEAICSGYAKTFSYLMGQAGYSTAYCTGYSDNGVYHAWNAVKSEDDKYYIDTTFNASENNLKYFWLTEDNMTDRTKDSEQWYVFPMDSD